MEGTTENLLQFHDIAEVHYQKTFVLFHKNAFYCQIEVKNNLKWLVNFLFWHLKLSSGLHY